MSDASSSTGATAAAPAAAAPTVQSVRAKGLDFLTAAEKAGGRVKAIVLEDLGLIEAEEKKSPFWMGFGAGFVAGAFVLLVVFAVLGAH